MAKRKVIVVVKPKKNMKGRPRGGASVPCPTCGKDSHVVITRRDDGSVLRKRVCSRNHTFATREEHVLAG